MGSNTSKQDSAQNGQGVQPTRSNLRKKKSNTSNQDPDDQFSPRSLNTVRFRDDDTELVDIETSRTPRAGSIPERYKQEGDRPWGTRPPPPSIRPERPPAGDSVPTHTKTTVPVAQVAPTRTAPRVATEGTPQTRVRPEPSTSAIRRQSDLPSNATRELSMDMSEARDGGHPQNFIRRPPVQRPSDRRDMPETGQLSTVIRPSPMDSYNPNPWLEQKGPAQHIHEHGERSLDRDLIARPETQYELPRLQYKPMRPNVKQVAPDDAKLQDYSIPSLLLEQGSDEIKEKEEDVVDANLRFYKNEIKSRPNGEYITTIHKYWFGDFQKLENDHAYIQWLFPLPETSSFNHHAVPLTPKEAKQIYDDPGTRARVVMSYRLMLDFYGMLLINEKSGQIKRSALFKDRFYVLKRSPHNIYRISRIIKSLGHLGFHGYQAPLVMFLLHEIFETREISGVSNGSIQHWIQAIGNPFERNYVEKSFDQWLKPDKNKKTDTDKGKRSVPEERIYPTRPAIRASRLLLNHGQIPSA